MTGTSESWGRAVGELYGGMQARLEAARAKVPTDLRGGAEIAKQVVRGVLENLALAHGALATVQALLPLLPEAERARIDGRRQAIAGELGSVASVLGEEITSTGPARPQTEFGVAPALAVLVQGGVWVGVTLAGVVLCYAIYTFASAAQAEAAALLVETQARVDYARRAGTNPGTNVADRGRPPDAGSLTPLLVGLGVLAAAGGGLYWYTQQKRG